MHAYRAQRYSIYRAKLSSQATGRHVAQQPTRVTTRTETRDTVGTEGIVFSMPCLAVHSFKQVQHTHTLPSSRVRRISTHNDMVIPSDPFMTLCKHSISISTTGALHAAAAGHHSRLHPRAARDPWQRLHPPPRTPRPPRPHPLTDPVTEAKPLSQVGVSSRYTSRPPLKSRLLRRR